MSIARALKDGVFGPEVIKAMRVAFEEAVTELKLSRRDPLTDTVVRKLMDAAKMGERDPARLYELAIVDLRARAPRLADCLGEGAPADLTSTTSPPLDLLADPLS